jgi:hypothetical protein
MKLWAILLAVAGVTVLALNAAAGDSKEGKKVDTRVFEMRIYYANPGKMKALHERFRKHTCKLFEKHDIILVGFWDPLDAKSAAALGDAKAKEEKMVYILAFPSREAAEKSWKAFREDPEWQKAKAESERDGVLVKRVDSIYLTPTDYSSLK